MTTETTKIHSDKYGTITMYEQFIQHKDSTEVTVYFKADERRWKYFKRDEDRIVSDKEVNWNDYLLGGRTFRLDMEQPAEWFYYTAAAKLSIIENEIGTAYEMDELPWYHVEPVKIDTNYALWSNETLWSLERYMHERIGELEIELRDLKREHAAVWRVGNNKFNWGDTL